MNEKIWKRISLERAEHLEARAALFDEMRTALAKVLMVSLLPRDVSGCQMVEDARQVLFKANKIAEARS